RFWPPLSSSPVPCWPAWVRSGPASSPQPTTVWPSSSTATTSCPNACRPSPRSGSTRRWGPRRLAATGPEQADRPVARSCSPSIDEFGVRPVQTTRAPGVRRFRAPFSAAHPVGRSMLTRWAGAASARSGISGNVDIRHLRHAADDLAAVAELVVVPDVDDDTIVIDDRGQAVDDAGALGADEVGGHELGGGDVVDLVAQRRVHRHLPQEGVELVNAGRLLEVEV